MRCIYCKDELVGQDPMTVAGIGIAHHVCHKKKHEEDRIFMGVKISGLNDDELAKLDELIQEEKIVRVM
jgi:hypothetical protein